MSNPNEETIRIGRPIRSGTDPSEAETVQFATVGSSPEAESDPDAATTVMATATASAAAEPGTGGGRKRSVLRAAGSMAIATLISRITGFLWKAVLVWIVGWGAINDSFTAANNLPNIITELLLGGVLASVVVPVLVRAQKEDADGGQAFTERLLTLAAVILGVGMVLSVLAAPLLTAMYVSDGDTEANPALATAFAYLLLPQILFYGMSALFMAILQAKQVFGPPAWAPVLNNVVILATLGAYALLPGEMTVDPVRMTDTHLLVLGLGVTAGVVVQAAVLLPALRRAGVSLRWRWGFDSRLAEFGGLAAWVLGYVAVSQVGLVALSRVATAYGGLAIYSNAWLLLQLPYGVIGFSIMTAILPRMSAAAASHDYEKLKDDLSLGSRMCTTALLPLSALMTVLGAQIGVVLFSYGASGVEGGNRLGIALAVSAFGVLPYAVTMLQLRAFYAMKDSRTPTLLMGVMTLAKVPLIYLCPLVLAPEDVVFGITFVNSLTFVVGWIAGEIWLRHRIGRLGSRALAVTIGKTLVGSVVGAGAAALIVVLTGPGGMTPDSAIQAWLQLIFAGIVGVIVTFGVMLLLKTRELDPVAGKLRRLVRR
ncbi:murein biosynthesis integral membrane protein MurJ [Actinoalloteichus spitiensis]|uniref:murein biosynthesis integral membrane protein MurJ n=1 Tax=Actinoalloteichus spitiensis TaxID=252394 RepID=UPI0003789AD5|nr:murein biosynthesis integral membrane protein MurJ [Actinoalloteichus spitiensis]